MSFTENQPKIGLASSGIFHPGQVHWNLPAASLVEETIRLGLGQMADNGALCVDTGEFTGRAPKDKFVVRDQTTEDRIWWGSINQPIEPQYFAQLKGKLQAFLQGRDLYVRDLYAGADPTYRLKVRVINTLPWANLFADNMFIRPTAEELPDFAPDWTVIAAPEFYADPEQDGTRQHNFAILNFSEKTILIGGSGYTGEIKKGIFTVMNYVLPQQGVLPMHCSANIGEQGDTAVFFGLSGTGKTTLSADPQRGLIGDDEHGWTQTGIFNFEGGCYAKCIDLTAKKEPEIWEAIKFNALVENTRFVEGTRSIDFHDTSVTENTRVSYPIHHIANAVEPSVGSIPQNIFFLTCDAFGVLPPISKLTPGQAMYQFISGYTAKVAGTEEGITEPVTVFSSCFGEPFLPLHPTRYAEMLGEKIREHGTRVWLINTGWTGGPYGTGSRMKLRYTRAMITAALEGKLDEVAYETDPIFGLAVPTEVAEVPPEVLNPRNTWADQAAYDVKAKELAQKFNDNFAQYSDFANDEIRAAAPKVMA
jgi:phosphoenolpyruvate carboxykinase (ATP)